MSGLARLVPVRRRHGLLVTPSTILRWHRDPATRRWTNQCAPARPTCHPLPACAPCHPPGQRELNLGYRRIHGELTALGYLIGAYTTWKTLHSAASTPQPGEPDRRGRNLYECRHGSFWPATYFISTPSPRTGSTSSRHRARHPPRAHPRRHRPTGAWLTQQARDLPMELDEPAASDSSSTAATSSRACRISGSAMSGRPRVGC